MRKKGKTKAFIFLSHLIWKSLLKTGNSQESGLLSEWMHRARSLLKDRYQALVLPLPEGQEGAEGGEEGGAARKMSLEDLLVRRKLKNLYKCWPILWRNIFSLKKIDTMSWKKTVEIPVLLFFVQMYVMKVYPERFVWISRGCL